MCEFTSGVLDKLSAHWLKESNSHTEIIKRCCLREMCPDGITANILKYEITPPAGNPRAPLADWEYRVDQDIFPDWFEPVECECRAREALARRATEEGWFATDIVGAGESTICGYAGTATAGDDGMATAGDDGMATAGNRGTATAGNRGTATAGYAGTATAGDDGEIRIRYWDPKTERHRTAVGYIGEDGLEPNTAYILDKQHRFARK